MSRASLDFVVPGPLDQLTGGYIYDARMVRGLEALAWDVRVHELPGRFPDADPVAAAAVEETLASVDDGGRVVLDGLAIGGLPAPLERHGGRVRSICMLHHPLAEETGIPEADAARFRETERRALAACSGVIVSSEFTASTLSEYGVAADRIRVVVPGTEPSQPAEGPRRSRAPLLVCAASVTPRKGHDVLVGALEQVSDLEWTCVCAGSLERDPAHAQSVRSAVARAGLEDRVAFVGELGSEALATLYGEASAFVLASRYEGYGMALAEALARGLPIVSTTGGAIPYTVPSDAGLLVEPDSPTAFAAALRTLLGTSGRRAGLAAAARRHADNLPTWDDSVRAFAAALSELTP